MSVANPLLQTYLERIERQLAAKADIDGTLKDIFAEAKGNGFSVKTLRALIKERAQDPAQRQEAEQLLSLYRDATAGKAAE